MAQIRRCRWRYNMAKVYIGRLVSKSSRSQEGFDTNGSWCRFVPCDSSPPNHIGITVQSFWFDT